MNDAVYEQIIDDHQKKKGPSLTFILIAGLCIITVLIMYYILLGRWLIELCLRLHKTHFSVHGDQQKSEGRLEEIKNQTENMIGNL